MEIKKNDLFDIFIEDMSEEGEGIGKVDGFTLFVKGAVIGDQVRVKVMKTKKTYGYARLMEVLTPSPDRVEPVCPVAGPCGGCQLQFMDYKAQLSFKERKVKECMERIGGITFGAVAEEIAAGRPEFLPILGMEHPVHYRNKAQYPVGRDKNGKIVTGFYATHSHTIVSCDTCEIQAPVNEVICRTVRNHMEQYGILPYEEETHQGLVRHILTRVGAVTGEVLVCLIINGTKLPQAEQLAAAIAALL